jgi:hypothetical protein
LNRNAPTTICRLLKLFSFGFFFLFFMGLIADQACGGAGREIFVGGEFNLVKVQEVTVTDAPHEAVFTRKLADMDSLFPFSTITAVQ